MRCGGHACTSGFRGGLVGRAAAARLARLGALDKCHVGVLETRAAHLELGDVRVLRQQVSDEDGRVALAHGVHVASSTGGPAHFGGGRELAGELVGTAVGDDPPLVEHEDPVGDLFGLVQVVGRDQDRRVLEVGQPVDEIVEVATCMRIEARGGFVEKDDLGAAHDPDRDVEATPLPARQGHDFGIRTVCQTDDLDELVHIPRPRDFGGGKRGVEPRQIGEQLADAPELVVAPRLQHDAEPGPPRFVASCGIGAEDGDITGRPHAETFEDLDRGRLPRAVRPEQGQHLTALRGEGHPSQHVLGAVSHSQVTHVERGRGSFATSIHIR